MSLKKLNSNKSMLTSLYQTLFSLLSLINFDDKNFLFYIQENFQNIVNLSIIKTVIRAIYDPEAPIATIPAKTKLIPID